MITQQKISEFLEEEIIYLTQLPTSFSDVKLRINHLEFIKKEIDSLFIKEGKTN